MKPLLVSSGEPAGIGPDICLTLADHPMPLVVLGDKQLLIERARLLGLALTLEDYVPGMLPTDAPGTLTVLSVSSSVAVSPGELSVEHAPYVMNVLTTGVERCLSGEFSALITAPVHKGILNEAGFDFTGHTEFLADKCGVDSVVMLLAGEQCRVALATTHMPLKQVAETITQPLLTDILQILHHSLKYDFGIQAPKIAVAGLNPHAGDLGHLGDEEINIIQPVISTLQQQGLDVSGPYSADTMFCKNTGPKCDVYVAMYHDQGLPVLKYATFGQAVNVTLGLPIVRTSVDHGTACPLAATGKADPSSLLTAVDMATSMVQRQEEA